jgi:hypothetical chaperone protein
VFQFEPVAAGLDFEATLSEEKRVLVVDIGGGTTDCSLLLMGPQWREKADRQQSLLGHSGCRVGGNDLDIALAFKCLMPLLGMGGDTEKGIALPILPWWNAVAINDVPAQTDFYSAANGRLLNDLLRSARDSEKVALLLKVWRQRLSYRLVRSAERAKSPFPRSRASPPGCRLLATSWRQPSASRVWKLRWISRWPGSWSRFSWRWITVMKNRT